MDSQAAHAVLDFAEAAAPKLRSGERGALLEQLEQRYGDVQAAFEWFIAHERADESRRLSTALLQFWLTQKRLAEGSAWVEQALALPGGDDGRRGRSLFDAGYLAYYQGKVEQAWSLYAQSVAVGRHANNPTVIALALVGMARLVLRDSKIEEARRLCREALAVTDGTTDRLGRSGAMHVLAVAAQMAGDLLEARDIMRQRIDLAREEGNVVIVSSESGNLSMVERQLGNLERAETLGQEALSLDYQRADHLSMPWKVNGLAAVALEKGEFERAASLIGAADAMLAAAGTAWPPDEQVQYDQTVTRLMEALGAAGLEQARAAGRALPVQAAVAFALRRDVPE
jgi:non-specific serine/threonine protein kinase